MKNFVILLALAPLLFGGLFYLLQGSSEIDGKSNESMQQNNQDNLNNKDQLATLNNVIESESTTSLDKSINMSAVENKINTKNMQTQNNTLEIKTSKGNIIVELNSEIAPNTVANFVKLAESKFYDGVKFHRVIKGFMIQTGDPNSKNDNAKDTWGMGGPGYKFADETMENGKAKSVYTNGYKRGVVAMANSGPNTNGSQFFIMHADYPLPSSYTIFGKVTSGLDTVDAIANVEKDRSDKPLQNVIIESIKVK